MTKLDRLNDGTLPKYAWPGMYPLMYLCADSGILCADCANGKNGSDASETADDAQWRIVASDINYEDPDLTCDHCRAQIECAYCD